MRKEVSNITLEMMGLKPSVHPLLAILTEEKFEFLGYFRSTAHCQLDLFQRGR